MDKSATVRCLLKKIRAFSPHYYDRGLTIATEASPTILAREALNRIRRSRSAILDKNDVLQFLAFAAGKASRSPSQYSQDLWALWEADGNTNGFFVEFGVADGRTGSNTYYLEKKAGWRGIVAEPNPAFLPRVRNCRDCHVSNKAVYCRSGERIEFLATHIGELSRIASIDPRDNHDRAQHNLVLVETISLNDLLDEGRAPTTVDFMSIDTEGSEYQILSSFDFDRWNVRTIAVEHNHTSARDKIYQLLTGHGYRRKWADMSYVDDWYVLE